MEKTKKSFYKISIIILITLAVFASYFYYQSKFQLTDKSITKQIFAVYFKTTSQKNFVKKETVPGKTALDLTKEAALIKMKGEGVNAYITEINGIIAQDSKKEYWAFFVNGKMAQVGAGSYKLKDRDKIEWQVKKY